MKEIDKTETRVTRLLEDPHLLQKRPREMQRRMKP